MHIRFKVLLLASATFGSLYGCGGGMGASPVAQTVSLGNGHAMLQAQGATRPEVQEGYGTVSATSMTATNITNLTLMPPQTLANTVIAYTDNSGSVWCYNNSTGTSTNLTKLTADMVQAASCTADGRIGFAAFDAINTSNAILACNYDGTGLTKILDSSLIDVDTKPAFSPDGKKVAFLGSDSYIHLANMDGSNPTTISVIAESTDGLCFSPDSTKIAFIEFDGSYDEICTVPATGGSATSLTSPSDATNFSWPSWSPDGNWILCSAAKGGNSSIAMVDTHNAWFTTLPTPSGDRDVLETVSPDGSTIAFGREVSGGEYDIWTETASGSNQSFTISTDLTSVSWSPFFPSRQFLGTNGTMGKSAQGFIWGQNGSSFSSLVTYTANGSSTVTAVGNSSESGDLVYDIHANSITGVQFSNGYFDQPTSFSNSGSDVLVTIDNATGQAATIAPFIATRAAGKPRVTRSGTTTVYRGKFTGFWTQKGINAAPNGASQVTVDSKSGAVLTVQ